MLKSIVDQWDARKHKLREYLEENHPTFPDSGCGYTTYYSLVYHLVDKVLTEPIPDHYSRLDPEKIHVIDDGDYQGTQIFLIPQKTYQPGAYDYVWFENHYGSCSVCDTMEWIRSLGSYGDEKPTEEQVDEYMKLALHMVQRMKILG